MTETHASDHGAWTAELCPRCQDDELDPWSVHTAHDDDYCEGPGWCSCPEVCEACCTDCNPPAAP